MKEVKRDLINEVIQGTINRLEKLENFTLEQAPDLCREIVLEEKTKEENEIIVSILGTLAAVCFLCGAIYTVSISNGALQSLGIVMAIICSVLTPISAGFALVGILNLRVIKVAPKPLILRKLKWMLGR